MNLRTNEENIRKHKVSKSQRLLWKISGAEISILEECVTDHNKYSAIGMTILMTTVIAFFSGGSAAWFFSKDGVDGNGSWIATILFGLLWAMLIFSIDRSLVITLKKDPTMTKQKFLAPFLSRAVLAILIAFMVSIPLELIIFKDFIREKDYNFKEENAKEFVKSTLEQDYIDEFNSNIKESKTEKEKLSKTEGYLTSEISKTENKLFILKAKLNNPPSITYKNVIKRIAEEQNKINRINELLNDNNNLDRISLSERMSLARATKNKYSRIRDREIQSWNSDIRTQINNTETELNSKKNEKSTCVQKTQIIENKNKKYNEQKDSLSEKQKMKTGGLVKAQEQSNNFIEGFRVLEFAVWDRDKKTGELNNGTVLFFLYLIRFLFFMIEILPTIVKIVTPIGNYDRKIYQEEKNLELHLSSTLYQEYIENLFHISHEARVQLEKDRIQAESEMHQELINQIKTAQLEVARSRIDNWKQKEIN